MPITALNSSFEVIRSMKEINQINNLFHATMTEIKTKTEGHRDNN